jgi:hypothetical protein
MKCRASQGKAIDDWFDTHRTDPKYRCSKSPDADWRVTVDAAKLLQDLFVGLSEARVTYRKPEHSVAITKWLLEKDSTSLKEVAELICDSLQTLPVEQTAGK